MKTIENIIDKSIQRAFYLNDCDFTRARIMSMQILGTENLSELFRYFLNNYEKNEKIINLLIEKHENETNQHGTEN